MSAGSIYFNNSNGAATNTYLTTPANNSNLYLNGDFTIEFWFNCGTMNSNYPRFFSTNTTWVGSDISHSFRYVGIQGGRIWLNSQNQNPYLQSNRTNLNDNNWHNVAIVQSITNNYINLFIDGVSDISSSSPNGYGLKTWDFGTYGMVFGSNPNGTNVNDQGYNGFLSNVRIVNGSTLYLTNYTPSPLVYTNIPNTVLILQTAFDKPFVDSSSLKNTITVSPFTPNISSAAPVVTSLNDNNGSIAFNNIAGQGDNSRYIYSAPNPRLILDGNFTLEFWFNCGKQNETGTFINTNNSYTTTNNVTAILTVGNAQIALYSPTVGGVLYTGTRTGLNDNKWHNVAFVQNRTNNILYVFIDGILDGTTRSIVTWDFGTYGITIGNRPQNGNCSYNGYISNLRIVKGYCLYTYNYNPATTNYGYVPGTVLLLNTAYNNAFVDSSPNNITITNSANRTIESPISPFITNNPYFICFKEDTKILCLFDNFEVYIPIQHIRKGHLVKTLSSGFVPVHAIGSSKIYNPDNKLVSKNRLFKYTKEEYPEITEDLVVTGCHSILVDTLTDKQKEDTIEDVGRILITENKYRLFTFLNDKAEPYEDAGLHTIWHLALEHDDYFMNYGIYANGLLVESASKRMLKEYSGMEIIE